MTKPRVWMPRVESEQQDTPDEARFRRRAREWLAANAPHVAEEDWSQPDLDAEVVAGRLFQGQIHDAGFAGISVPAIYGGVGLSVRWELIWSEECAEYRLPLSYLMLGLHLCAPTLVALGSEDLKLRLLGPLLQGAHLWCQLFSEPGAGSDLGAVDTRARRDGEHWIVSGQKVWNSLAQFADMGMLVARTGPVESRHRGLTMFALDMTSPGVSVRPIRQITGVPEFNEVFLDDVRIPATNVVGEVDGGWAAVLTMLMNERVALATSDSVGNTDVGPLVELARSTGAERDPHFRQRFGLLYTRAVTINLLAARLKASLRSDESPPGPEGSIAKLLVSQVLRERADMMLDAANTEGVCWRSGEPDDARWAFEWLAAPAISLGGGTDAIQRNVLAERILGMPREPSSTGNAGARRGDRGA